jgi:hypothetical protein
MDYQIISFDQQQGSIQVLFKNGIEDVGIWNVDIPINDQRMFITGDELNNHIMSMYPSWVIERMEKLKAGVVNSSDIQALVVPLSEPQMPVLEDQPIAQNLQET